ncbi:aldo/keto reductase family oxidoreductase [uncultured Polaribacter sp.]|jgi:predicted oxidoreductase|uniref:aldo/keto reductase n=1 Tax=uncultured Polaribacter sp. TaxID=174711 RepID=UPI003704CCD3|tara:strand:- start:1096 stop:1956 length:861 start_codon:yes stop_codon:yes gene_type:complete
MDSKIIIGCMSWGVWGKQFSTKEQIDMIRFCTENGNTIFDHADIYGNYTTEAGFGKAFIDSGINREDIQLISKCGIQLINERRGSRIKHYKYAKEYIISSAEASLKNLKTDYLDTFLLHRPSPLMQPDEISEAITILQDSGKIINFGLSNFTPSQVDLIANSVPVTANQIEFSLTKNDAMFNGTLDKMLQEGIQTMSWSPLGAVFKDETAQTKRIKAVLKKLTKKYEISEDVILLAFILRHPAKVAPVVGTTNKERILNANSALNIHLELQDWFEMLAASQGYEVA